MNFRYIPYNLIIVCFFVCQSATAQDFYNDIIKKNLQQKEYSLDTEASAIVLYEKTSEIITPTDTWFEKKKICHRIIKILRKDAFDLANVQVIFPYNNYKNYVAKVKGITYNTASNDTVTSSITNKDLYTKRLLTNIYEMSFSLPAVKEGSIIEYSYEVNQDFEGDIFTWEVQTEYPKLFTEYTIDYPNNIQFTTLMHVRETPHEYKSESEAVNASDNFSTVSDTRHSYGQCWIRRDVPGLKNEPYVIDKVKYLERIELELTEVSTHKGNFYGITSWEKLNDKFWKDFGWGKALSQKNNFFDAVLDTLIKPGDMPIDNAKKIFSYVRSHFKCNEDPFTPKLSTSEIFNDNEGNEGEINFVLTSMLRHVGLDAAPVLLSTAGNMPMSSSFPMLDRIKYLGCALKIDSNYIFLDASNKNNVFGRLPVECYNGYSWILGEHGIGILLIADRLKDKTVYAIKISEVTDSSSRVDVVEKIGLIQSELLRKKWAKDEDEQKKFITKQELAFPTNYKVKSHSIENENNPDTNMYVKYICKITFDKGTSSIFLTNILRTFTENPFRATIRRFPIEYQYQTETSSILNAVLPDNMEPDSIPKPLIIKLGDDDMTYTNTVMSYNTHSVVMNTRLAINTTSYPPESYDAIRHYIETIIEQENRAIIIKRK